jgi:hypothetical protein
MTIKEVQERIDSWIRKFGVRYFNELTNMSILTDLDISFQKNLEKKTSRDFDRHQQNDKLR